MMRTVLFAICFAGPLCAQSYAPETSPTPPQNPLRSGDAAVDRLIAPEKNDALALEDIPTGMRDQLLESDAEHAKCLASLNKLGVAYSVAEPIIEASDADCGILRPLKISKVAPSVSVQPPATLRCDTARALAVWTKEFVIPASERMPERGALTVIEKGSGYVCRRRNNLPDGKLSEHAFGNAFDVMAFGFADGSRVAIQPREAEGSMAEAFQDAVRASACLDFSTVLGPGSNASHADHLHLDIIARGSGYRLCEQGGAKPVD